jgi:hypothetical protein
MMCLKLVKTALEEAATYVAARIDGGRQEGLLHDTAILKKLVAPWTNSDRIVCADS